MDGPSTIETLTRRFESALRADSFAPVVVGVVGSGNLEVLAEPADHDECRIVVETSARGFATIWDAVLAAFHARFGRGGVAFTIHDMGATPAVVSLRLDQAAAAIASRPGRGNA